MATAAKHRLFFAVWPDAAARERLAALVAGLTCRHDARWVKPARWHLTLAFLGTTMAFPDALAQQALAVGAAVHAPTFAWCADVVRSFGDHRPTCVLGASRPCPPLQSLRRDVLQALAGAGVALPDRRPYVPHVTLGYAHGQALEPERVAAIDVAVGAFVLLHSVAGEARYRELNRWSLGPHA